MWLPHSPFKLLPNHHRGFLSKQKGIWMALYLLTSQLCFLGSSDDDVAVCNRTGEAAVGISDTITGHQGDAGSQTPVLAAATTRRAHLAGFGLHVSVHLAGFGLCFSALTTALELALKVKCSWSRGKGIVTFRMLIFFFQIH